MGKAPISTSVSPSLLLEIIFKMKLIAGIVFVCFFLLIEAGRVPDNSDISISDELLDDVKNVYSNPEKSLRRRKRHYFPHSRYFLERGMDRNFYESYQDDRRITELEIRLQIQQEQINELLFRRCEPKVIVVPVYLPSSGNTNTSDPLGVRYGVEDEIERERLWGSEDDLNGMRPISLRPVRPSRPMPKQPPVQHGTIQAETSTKAPIITICKTAILICCDKEEDERRKCFLNFNCPKVASSDATCSKSILDRIKNEFIAAYAPDGE
ncbi:unnamed protein product [Pieris brassicae]|uniref:Uncharacterized protein n=1 Tax=Pieris brassicae TaxID=7116 RepID=A0A9P0TTS6_PIEBR|nr:unnamed protein product [Pieris brassicae]